MKRIMRWLVPLLLIFSVMFLSACTPATIENHTGYEEDKTAVDNVPPDVLPEAEGEPDENVAYYSTEEVAEYIHIYQKLPPNYITKREAMELGWESQQGNLWDVTDKMCIGGDAFGNREGLLPKASGRKWYECDVNYYGGFRGGERIVYSNDGLIYFTDDHYASFTQIY